MLSNSYTWSDKVFKGTVVNRELSSLLRGSLEITRTLYSPFKQLFSLTNQKWIKYSYLIRKNQWQPICTEISMKTVQARAECLFDWTVSLVYTNLDFLRTCKIMIELPSMQRWQCPIYNVSLEVKSFVCMN